MAVTTKKAKEEVSNPEEDCSTICLPDRDAKIAEIAYRRAENRGFAPGHELEDWLEACCNDKSDISRNTLSGG